MSKHFEDITKISLEDLRYYYNKFVEQGKNRLASRLKNEIEKRK